MEPAPPPLSAAAERFRRAKALFLACRELPPEQREARLEAECGGQAELRAEVEALLAADAEAGEYLEHEPGWRARPPGGPSLEGRLLGPYRVERELGAGGMGTVFLAARADGEFERKVAIKVLRGAFGGREALRRFRAERQILARLRHANIAELHDGGSTEDGLVYLVMELAEGEPLVAHCRRRRLGLDERLELFAQVCSAVRFAHQNLVIHRDLKPANILVTAEGVPKLLDFGIAKLLAEEGAAGATATLERALTPEYASPEQVRGEVVNTTTDVYSLGVLLYELVTDRHPYRLGARGLPLRPDELLRAVCEQDPVRASSAVATGGDSLPWSFPESRDRLARRLAVDLDVICAKALRKEPEARYASVEQLAEDVRRSRQGLPIEARPATVRYRLRKFVARSPLLAASATLLVLFTLGMAVLSLALVRQRDRARLERAKAERVAHFTAELFEVSSPAKAQGEEITARALLEEGAQKIGGELQEQPEVRAAMLDVLGGAFFRLGHYDRAEPLLREALASRRTRAAEAPEELAESLDNLAELHRERGQLDRAEPLYREALALRRRHRGESALGLAESLNNLGVLLAGRGDLEGATAHIHEALEVTRGELGADDPRVATALRNLAALLQSAGRASEAIPLLRDALAIHRARLGDKHPEVLIGLFNLAMLEADQGEWPAADARFAEVLERSRDVFGRAHPYVQLFSHGWAALLLKEGRAEEAQGLLAEAVEAARQALPADHPDLLAMSNALARARLERGELAEAEILLDGVLAVERTGGRLEARTRAAARRHLGRLRLEQGRLEEAEAEARGAVEQIERELTPAHSDRPAALLDLARVLLARGELPAAENAAREAYEQVIDRRGARHPERLAPGLLFAEALCRHGREGEGRALLRDLGFVETKAPGPGSKNGLRAALLCLPKQ